MRAYFSLVHSKEEINDELTFVLWMTRVPMPTLICNYENRLNCPCVFVRCDDDGININGESASLVIYNIYILYIYIYYCGDRDLKLEVEVCHVFVFVWMEKTNKCWMCVNKRMLAFTYFNSFFPCVRSNFQGQSEEMRAEFCSRVKRLLSSSWLNHLVCVWMDANELLVNYQSKLEQ